MSQEKIAIGKLGKVHGLRGELRLWAYNPDSELLRAGLQVTCATGRASRELTIERIRPGDKFLIVSFQGVAQREQAEALVNAELLVPRQSLPKLTSREFYLIDLIEQPVYVIDEDSPEGEAVHVGHVEGFFETPAHEIMRLTLLDGASLLVPFVMNEIVLEVDLEEGVVLAPLRLWAPEDVLVPGLNAPLEDEDEDEDEDEQEPS